MYLLFFISDSSIFLLQASIQQENTESELSTDRSSTSVSGSFYSDDSNLEENKMKRDYDEDEMNETSNSDESEIKYSKYFKDSYSPAKPNTEDKVIL